MAPKNDELAFKFAQRAAQSDFPTAEFALGYFYEVGICVPVDIKEARSWYSKAASSGNKDATNRIDSISRSKTLSKKDHEKVAIQVDLPMEAKDLVRKKLSSTVVGR